MSAWMVTPGLDGLGWSARITGPHVEGPVEVVPRSEAEALAEAIEKTAAKGSSAHLGKTLAAYRAAYPPREEMP